MKRITALFTIITLVFSLNVALGQNVHKYCGHSDLIQNAMETNANYLNDYAAKFAEAKEAGNRIGDDTTYTIQVVVHVLYEEGDPYQYISDELIHSQIDALNRDYNLLNDTSITRDEFKDVIGKARINFELTKVRPNGNCTNGIVRKQVNIGVAILPSITDGFVKDGAFGGSSAWNTNKYLNIWVVDLNKFGDPTQGFLGGFAYFPDMQPRRFNGVVIDFRFFGQDNPYIEDVQPGFARYAKGRTTAHEVGHWLGLFHTWGALGQIDPSLGCTDDDFIDDTPLNSLPYASHGRCEDTIVNSCIQTPVDLPDMYENYMDYSSDDCYTMFTLEQVAVMRGVMKNERSALNWTPVDPITTDAFSVSVVENESVEICFELENCFVSNDPQEASINGVDSTYTSSLGMAEILSSEYCVNYTAGAYNAADNVDEFTVEIYNPYLDKTDIVEIDVTIEQGEVVSGIKLLTSAKNNIDVFPNPTNGKFSIQFGSIPTQMSLQIFDAIGQKVVSQTFDGEQTLEIDLTGFAKGAYILHFENDDFKTFEKILLK